MASEAEEVADSDLTSRLVDRDEDPGLCPYEYVLWARIEGRYQIIGSALVAAPTAPADLGTTAVQKVAK